MDRTEQWGTVGCVAYLLWVIGCVALAPRDQVFAWIVAPIALLILAVVIAIIAEPRPPRS